MKLIKKLLFWMRYGKRHDWYMVESTGGGFYWRCHNCLSYRAVDEKYSEINIFTASKPRNKGCTGVLI